MKKHLFVVSCLLILTACSSHPKEEAAKPRKSSHPNFSR